MKSLTTLIEESGLSHAEIARQAGVHRTTVSRIVHGKQQMRADTAQRLASAHWVYLWKPSRTPERRSRQSQRLSGLRRQRSRSGARETLVTANCQNS